MSYDYLFLFVILALAGYLFDKLKLKEEKYKQLDDYDFVKKYLLSDDALNGNKPIIWIHLDFEINSRNWISFGSRNSRYLNQPYKMITMQSIINKSNGDFNVCIIDDDSFGKLLSNWTIDLHKIAEPLRGYMRNLAIMNLIYKYGGMVVPSSYLALQPMINIYNKGMNNSDSFIIENTDRNITSTYVQYFPTHKFMGGLKGSNSIYELIKYIEIINSHDYTNEQLFIGKLDRKCYELIYNGRMKIIDGKHIGIKTKINKPVIIDNLLQSSYIDFIPDMHGIYIPDNEILSRVKYEWFSRLSPEQVYNADTILSKYMLLSNS